MRYFAAQPVVPAEPEVSGEAVVSGEADAPPEPEVSGEAGARADAGTGAEAEVSGAAEAGADAGTGAEAVARAAVDVSAEAEVMGEAGGRAAVDVSGESYVSGEAFVSAEVVQPPGPAHDEVVGGPHAFTVLELSARCAELEIRLDVAEAERWNARSLLMSLPKPLLVVDPFGEVLLLSRAAGELFALNVGYGGYPPLASVVLDAQLADEVRAVCRMHARGQEKRLRWTLPTAGGFRDFDIRIVCLADVRDGRPSPWGAAMVLEEVRPRELDKPAARIRAETLAQIAGQLRPALSALKVQSELLRGPGGLESAQAREELLARVGGETDRLLRLLECMQLLARIEAGLAVGGEREFAPGALARRSAEALRPSATWRGVLLSTADIPGDHQLAPLVGDPELLGSALTQALAGAIAATPPGETVRLGVQAAGGFVSISITAPGALLAGPPGPGRSPDAGPLILSLLRAVVETVHGGTVVAEAHPGFAARLTLRIPVRHRSSREAPCPA